MTFFHLQSVMKMLKSYLVYVLVFHKEFVYFDVSSLSTSLDSPMKLDYDDEID